MPSINLLPWRADLRKRRQKEFLIGLAGAAGLAVLIGLLAHFTVSTMIDAQQAKNDLLKSEITKLDKQIEEIIALEEEKARMVARMEVIEKLQKSRPEVVKVFDELVSTLPEGVYLTSVKQSVRRLELNGVAQSSTRVSALMRNIDAAEVLGTPDLKVIETGAPGSGSKFTLFSTLKTPAGEEAAAEPVVKKRVKEASR